MLDLFFGLKRVVKRQPVLIDNSVFRMHWLFSSLLLAACSLLITSHQYVGQPIDCLQTDRLPTQLLNTYCWMHSTYTLPPDFQHGEQAHPGLGNSRSRPDPNAPVTASRKYYTYYQWVCFALFVQSIFFYLPYYLWKIWEGGLLRAITSGMQIALVSEEERGEKRQLLNQYLYRHLQLHRPYALKYFFCEFLCLFNVLAQFWFTNWLFDGDFFAYGIEVLRQGRNGLESAVAAAAQQPDMIATGTATGGGASSSTDKQLSGSPAFTRTEATRLHPMLRMFPRITKCSFHSYGYSGDIQRHDALCLLPLNVLNEKIYLVIWVWFVVLLALLVLVLLYRVLLITGIRWRAYFLRSRCRLSNECDLMCICALGNVGDWFLLYMLAANIDPLLMHEITSEMADQLRHRQRTSVNSSISSGRCSSCLTDSCDRSKWFLSSNKSLEDQCMRLLPKNHIDCGRCNHAYSASSSGEADKTSMVCGHGRGRGGGAGDLGATNVDDTGIGSTCGGQRVCIGPDMKTSSHRSADSGVSGSSGGGWSLFGCTTSGPMIDNSNTCHTINPCDTIVVINDQDNQCTNVNQDHNGNGNNHSNNHGNDTNNGNGNEEPENEHGLDRDEQLMLDRHRQKNALKCMKRVLGSTANVNLNRSNAIDLNASPFNTAAFDANDAAQLDHHFDHNYGHESTMVDPKYLWNRPRNMWNNRLWMRSKGIYGRKGSWNKLKTPLGLFPFTLNSMNSSNNMHRQPTVNQHAKVSTGNSSVNASAGTSNIRDATFDTLGTSNNNINNINGNNSINRAASAASVRLPVNSASYASNANNANAKPNKSGLPSTSGSVSSAQNYRLGAKNSSNMSTLKCKSDQYSASKSASKCPKSRPNQSKR